MNEFDIGIAAKFAENRGPLDCLVRKPVQLAEQSDATDITHGRSPLRKPAIIALQYDIIRDARRVTHPGRQTQAALLPKGYTGNFHVAQHQAYLPGPLVVRVK